jgi:hypothetical protein
MGAYPRPEFWVRSDEAEPAPIRPGLTSSWLIPPGTDTAGMGTAGMGTAGMGTAGMETAAPAGSAGAAVVLLS